MEESNELTQPVNNTGINSSYVFAIVIVIVICIIIYFVYTKTDTNKLVTKIKNILERQQKNLNLNQINMPE